MSTIDLQLTGGPELEKRLKELPDKVAINVLRAGTARGANALRDEMRRRAPILSLDQSRAIGGRPHEPGLLLRSIKARRLRQRDRNLVTSGVLIDKAAFYWRFLEFGTRRMAPHPFARPSVDTRGRDAAQTVIDYSVVRIEQEAMKKAL